jgi:hypothetical protein
MPYLSTVLTEILEVGTRCDRMNDYLCPVKLSPVDTAKP